MSRAPGVVAGARRASIHAGGQCEGLPALDEGREWPQALEEATRFASAIVARPSHERYRPGATDARR